MSYEKYGYEVEIEGLKFWGVMHYTYTPAKICGMPEDCYPAEFDVDYVTCECISHGDEVFFSDEIKELIYNDYAERVLDTILEDFRP